MATPQHSVFSVWFYQGEHYVGRVGGLTRLDQAIAVAHEGKDERAPWFSVEHRYDRVVICRNGLSLNGKAEEVDIETDNGDEVIVLVPTEEA